MISSPASGTRRGGWAPEAGMRHSPWLPSRFDENMSSLPASDQTGPSFQR